MNIQLEEYIVNKYGEEQSAIILTLAANIYNFSSSLSKTFRMNMEEQMVLLGYAYNMSREQFKEAQKNDFDEFFVKENLQDKIKSFKMPKGSVIIYNTHGIHRAKPAENSNFVRKSLFFQVDSNDRSEPILVNTSYFNKFDEIIKMYLGFGRDGSNISFPQTDESTIPDFELSNLIVNSKRMPVYGG